MIPKTGSVYTTISGSDARQSLHNRSHIAVTKFHNDQSELTGYTLDRWDLHGVPCGCVDCMAEYEILRMTQLAHDQKLLRSPS